MEWSFGAAVLIQTFYILWTEILHRRAARIIYNLPRDMPSDELYQKHITSNSRLYASDYTDTRIGTLKPSITNFD